MGLGATRRPASCLGAVMVLLELTGGLLGIPGAGRADREAAKLARVIEQALGEAVERQRPLVEHEAARTGGQSSPGASAGVIE